MNIQAFQRFFYTWTRPPNLCLSNQHILHHNLSHFFSWFLFLQHKRLSGPRNVPHKENFTHYPNKFWLVRDKYCFVDFSFDSSRNTSATTPTPSISLSVIHSFISKRKKNQRKKNENTLSSLIPQWHSMKQLRKQKFQALTAHPMMTHSSWYQCYGLHVTLWSKEKQVVHKHLIFVSIKFNLTQLHNIFLRPFVACFEDTYRKIYIYISYMLFINVCFHDISILF